MGASRGSTDGGVRLTGGLCRDAASQGLKNEEALPRQWAWLEQQRVLAPCLTSHGVTCQSPRLLMRKPSYREEQ